MRLITIAKLMRDAYYVHELHFLYYNTEYYKRKVFISCTKTSLKIAL